MNLGDLLSPFVLNPFFMTGELLKKWFTGGNHRVGRWDHDDANTSLGSTLLGLLFWGIVLGAVAWGLGGI